MTNQLLINNIEKYRRVQYLSELKRPSKRVEKKENTDITLQEEFVEKEKPIENKNLSYNELRIQSGYVDSQNNSKRELALTWKA